MNPLTHVQRTYQQIRIVAGSALIVLPLAIVLLAWDVKPTLSHYYFFEEHPGLIRTMFTGFLILVGGIMIAYKGFDSKDDWIHNLAGFFALCVAAFPKSRDADDCYYTTGLFSELHLPSAVLLFCLAAWAVWYCGGDNLKSRLNSKELSILNNSKWFSIGTMLAGIGIYIAFWIFGKIFSLPNVGILAVELLGFFGFASHWLVMTYLISTANTRKAMTKGAPTPPPEEDFIQ